MNIYLICTGNTCRSPMAEAILRSKEIKNVAVRSAGIHAFDGMPIAHNAKTLIEEADMPYTSVSRAVTPEDIEWADLIFTMTASHQEILLHTFPEAKEKLFTMKSFVYPDAMEDVHDPFGGNIETYRETFNELSVIMDDLKEKLRKGQGND